MKIEFLQGFFFSNLKILPYNEHINGKQFSQVILHFIKKIFFKKSFFIFLQLLLKNALFQIFVDHFNIYHTNLRSKKIRRKVAYIHKLYLQFFI